MTLEAIKVTGIMHKESIKENGEQGSSKLALKEQLAGEPTAGRDLGFIAALASRVNFIAGRQEHT